MSFRCTVPEAIEMRGAAYRKITRAVLDAMHAARLHGELVATKGDKEAGKALAERWSEHDHRFYRELRQSELGNGDGG